MNIRPHLLASKHRDFAVSGGHIRAKGAKPQRATTPFLITHRWGYAPVGEDGSPELYDLTIDPLAKHNIATDNLDIAAELHQFFTSHLADHHAPDEFMALWNDRLMVKLAAVVGPLTMPISRYLRA